MSADGVLGVEARPVRGARTGLRGGLKSGLLSAPAVLFVVIAFVVPVGVLVVYSFWPTNDAGDIVHRFTLANYQTFFESSVYVRALLRTFWMVGLASALTVAFTLPFAYFVATKVRPERRVAWILLAVMPFWSSYLIRVFSWLNIFGDSGAAMKALSATGIADTTPGFLQLGTPAIIVTFIYLLFPFAFLSTYVALERMDPTLREAAADVGARPWRMLARLTLPLTGSGLLAGFAFAFISMMGDYVTPSLIGGTSGSLYANLIVNQFGVSAQWGFGSALSLIMMVCVLVFLALLRRSTSGRQAGEFARRFVPQRAPFLRAYSLIFLAFLYLPIVLVVLFAFNSATYVGFPIQGLTTTWFAKVFDSPPVISAFETSLKVAGLAVLFALLIGVPAAIQLSRTTGFAKNVKLALLSLPLLVPPVVLGIGMLIGLHAVGVQRGLWTIVAGHTLLVLPIVVLIVMARLEGLERDQELAAMDLGARPWRTLLSVTLPQAMPAVVAAALLSLALSLDEFILTFLVTVNTTTLPLYIYSSLRFSTDPSIDAIAALVLALSFVLALMAMGLMTGFGRRQRAGAGGARELIDLVKA